MDTTDKKNFDELTTRLLTEHAGFAYAVSRIVAPSENTERVIEDAKRVQASIDTRTKENPIEAFCAPD